MDDVARLSATDRSDLFRAAAAQAGLPEAIIEKDFWVCWVLKRIFSLESPPAGLLFKGGTSLTKVYGVIDRFSEDVDLSFDRTGLGFVAESDPANKSKKKRGEAIEKLVEACKVAVNDKLRLQLVEAIAASLGTKEGWSLDAALDDGEEATLLFRYPASEIGRLQYIVPQVRLEFGARSDHWPAQRGVVKPFAAKSFPDRFEMAECEVKTLAAERTFWEKATILHQWYYAPEEKVFPDRQSRHYFDLYCLYKSPFGDRALTDLSLLVKVAEHKQIYFPRAWARYELAKPGTLRLVPNEARRAALKADYRSMEQMIFGHAPSLEKILEGLRELEEKINAKAHHI